MPSLFTRSRTTSTKNSPKTPLTEGADEFGRVTSRGSAKGTKDKRQRTKSNAEPKRGVVAEYAETAADGFLPTSMAPAEAPQQLYGYLSHERHVVLGVEDVTRLVEVVADELCMRGLTTPFLFSNTALDISPPAVRRLISSFLSGSNFHDECKFAGPHDLGMVIRWGLARVVRVMNGHEVRGLIGWDVYLAWRSGERTSNYPRGEFTRLLLLIPPPVRSLLITLLTLLTRLLANSTSSGSTPITLSSLFGPLLFGLGHLSLAFHYSYAAYLRSAHATEHLLLSFIRLQNAQASASTPIPSRLKSWIKGYPSMLAPDERLDKPRRGVRTVRLSSIRRNVRLYSPDLVKTCASWAKMMSDQGDFRSSKEWKRIAPASPNAPNLPHLPPRYSDAYRKRMDLPTSFEPDLGRGSPPSLSNSSSTASTTSTSSTLLDSLEFGIGMREGEDRFKSLTDLKWGVFEEAGFSDGDNKKLQFDLNESARSARFAKRATLTWADFSDSGFLRNETSLSTTLQFSAPLSDTISEWPLQAAEIQRKLKKSQKALPSFGWDTSPVMGSEEVIEEAFVDVFCDLIYGSGWMERGEGTFRDCNWALVEFKSLPASFRPDPTTSNDPRTSTTVLLFEEFVPYEYRVQLSSQGSAPSMRKRLPALFSTSKSRAWKPAATLNGRPYVVGTVPRSPTAREVEFEGLLRGEGGLTKVITLDQASKSQSQIKVQTPVKGMPVPEKKMPTISSPLTATIPTSSPAIKERELPESPAGPPARKSRFKLPVGGGNRHAVLIPAEYATVDFETRLADYSDEELSGENGRREGKHSSKDEAWVDILVASHGNRMGGQDAELRPLKGVRGLRGGKSDPELASQEVALALAAMSENPPSDDETDRDVERDVAGHSSTVRSRPGYFDLHPERRMQGSDSYLDPDDALQRYAQDRSLRTQGDDEVNIYGEPELGRPPVPPRESVYSDGDFEPTEHEYDTDQDIEVPAFVQDDTPASTDEKGHSKADSTTLPPSPVSRPGDSKSNIISPTPSRLPVRSPSADKNHPPLPGAPPSPSRLDTTLDAAQLLEDLNRNSPLRYIHGAPLHNVIEEGDEED